MPLRHLTLNTRGPGLTEITRDVAATLDDLAQGATGLATIFVQHTSCSLLIQENADPEVQSDLMAYFERLVPPADHPSMAYLTHVYEGADDMPAHIKSALLPTSLHIPVDGGRMTLGTWQGIYVVEHRRAPHHRRIVVHFSPDP